MKRLRVLIVDDAPDFLESATDFVSRDERATVVGCAVDGREAVRLARELSPDLVLMDVAMPFMTGFQAAALIKQEQPAIKVLLTSLYDEPAYHREAASVGADEFIGKQLLAEAIPELLKRWGA
jgi:DNA-binding NarL/FixJ family response regulator